MFGGRTCKRSGEIIIPQALLARMEDKASALASHNYCAEPFLLRFKQQVLPNFSYSDYQYRNSCIEDDEGGVIGIPSGCRTVVDTGFDSKLTAIVDAELASNIPSSERVYLLSGRKVSPATRKKERTEIEQHLASEPPPVSTAAQKIMGYLHDLDPGIFARKLNAELATARSFAATIDDEDRQKRAFSKLRAISDQPKPYYQPSAAGRTCRLYAAGPSMTNLLREVRKVLCRGWYEVDLCNAQLAILNALSGGRILAGYEGVPDMWREFANYCGGSKDALKKPLKNALYGIMFGERDFNTQRGLAQSRAAAFVGHPVIQRLYAARKGIYKSIADAKGMVDAFGVCQRTSPGRGKLGRKPNDVLASVLQSYEMRLIEPIYDLAISETRRFRIVLHLHDGVTIAIEDRDREAAILQQIEAAVARRGAQLNIAIRAESKLL
jgi:hypothetical protein